MVVGTKKIAGCARNGKILNCRENRATLTEGELEIGMYERDRIMDRV